MRRLKVLVAGYYGAGNIGDELLLAQLVEWIREYDADVTAISLNPEYTRDIHKIEALQHDNFPQLAQAMLDSDVLIMGGGGLFQDHHRFLIKDLYEYPAPGIAYFAQTSMMAAQFKLPVILWAMGVGPLRTRDARMITRDVFSKAYAVSVRDELSAKLLREIGIRGDIIVSPDPVWSASFNGAEAIKIRKRFPQLGEKKILAVIIREWYLVEGWEEKLARAIKSAMPDSWGCLWIPFQDSVDNLDRAAIQRIVNGIGNTAAHAIWSGASFTQVPSVLAQADAALVMRLHGVILAGRAGLPVATLEYDEKVSSAAEMLGIATECRAQLGDTSEDIARALRAVIQTAEGAGRYQRVVADKFERASLTHQHFLFDALNSIVKKRRPRPAWSRKKLDWLSVWYGKREQEIAERDRHVHELSENAANLSRELQNRAQEIAERDRHVHELSENAANLSRELQNRAREIEVLTHDLERLEQDRNALAAQLTAITNSRGWRILQVLWRIRLRLVPRGSLLARWLKAKMRAVSVIRSDGLAGLIRKAVTRALRGRVMTWYAYAFDRFKRARLAIYAKDLSLLMVPYERGLVSIVLPAYNGSDMLAEALDSILSQTYTHLEVIAIDDGSTDTTGGVLDDYARRDARVRVIHQENQKLPRTLSRGFRLARGEFLIWTSVDNRVAPDFLERMVACLERHPDWDMAYANMDIIGEDGTPLVDTSWYSSYQHPYGSEHIYLPEDPSELNVWPNNYIGAAFLYRARVAWLLGDYSKNRFTTEDYDYWMRVNGLLTLRHTDFSEPIYQYRFHENSLTHRDNELGITAGRVRLMVFDDFRRDFYLTPVTWIIEGNTENSEVQALVAQLEREVSRAGHICLEVDKCSPSELPRLWFPTVYVRVTDNPESVSIATRALPRNTLTVMLTTERKVLPTEVESTWDLCAAQTIVEDCPRLRNPYQGWIASLDIKQLFTAIDIRAKTKQLEAIESEITRAGQGERLKLSVIICTYKRGELLRNAVTAVADQTLPLCDYEVLVVNNDPTDGYPDEVVNQLCQTHFSDFPGHIRLVDCHIPGLSHARNAGISEAKGEILCFIDDDAIAQESCLENIVRAFESNPTSGVVGGHIRLKIPEPRPWAFKEGWEGFWSELVTAYSRYTEVEHWWEFPWGANWSARRLALLEIGGFRANYGRRGNDFGGGEEVVAGSLIKKLGYTIAIMPEAEVLHDVDPSRYTLQHVKRTIIAATLVNYRIQRDLYVPMESNLGATRRGIGSALRQVATAMWRSGWRETILEIREAVYHLHARLILASRQMRDLFQRLRRPAAISEE